MGKDPLATGDRDFLIGDRSPNYEDVSNESQNVVNAGADLDFDAVGGLYVFDLRLDGSVIAGTTRNLQFAQTTEDGPDFMPISLNRPT